MEWSVGFSSLEGKVFSKVYKEGESIIFENEDERYELYHDQDCCEDVRIEDVCGDLHNLENAEITFAQETSSEGETGWGTCTWTFYKLATEKGWVDIRFYGESNGYYSESANLHRYEKGDW